MPLSREENKEDLSKKTMKSCNSLGNEKVFIFRQKLLQICKISYKSRKKVKLTQCKVIFVIVPCICTLVTYCSLHRKQEMTVQPQRQSQSNAVSMWSHSLQKLQNCNSSDLVQISAEWHAAPRRVGDGDSWGAAQQPPGPLLPSFCFEGHNPRENNLFQKAHEVEQKQASAFHRNPETMGRVIIWMWLFMLTSPLAIFLSYFDIYLK